MNTKNKFTFRTRAIGDWTGFITENMGIGPVSAKEHTAFLIMKYLLGYLYQTLSSASAKIAVNSVVGAGGPWWLLQVWLNLHTIKVSKRSDLAEADFLALEPTEDDEGNEITTRRCMSFGEAACSYAGSEQSTEFFSNWFSNFYDGFLRDSRILFAYEHSNNFEYPADFRFDDINSEKFEKSREVFAMAISPCILPVGIHQGRNIQVSYEFYHPMSAARQHGMGQLPIGLFFANKIQTTGEITSVLMMDRLLNIPGPPLGSIENIQLALARSKAFDQWWIEWKKHIFHESASMYLTKYLSRAGSTKSSPPHVCQSGVNINYAPGLLPKGGGLAPSIIGYNAPKTSTLLYGRVREPIPSETVKRKRTKSSAADPSAAKKNKSKKQKTATADDLPSIDLDVEKFLDNEEIEEGVDDAAADISEAREQMPPADILLADVKQIQSFQPPHSPTHLHHESSEHTPSAVGSHHLKEEVEPTPAIPVSILSKNSYRLLYNFSDNQQSQYSHFQALADMFSFDIKQFFDKEEETTSLPLALLADDVKATLRDIAHRLGSSLESLVVDCGPIRARFEEIHDQIPEDQAKIISPVVYLELHRFKLEKARQRIADRRERKELEATIQANRQTINEEKSTLDEMTIDSVQANIDRLKTRRTELLAELEKCEAEISSEEQRLADFPRAIEEQRSKIRKSIKHLSDLSKSLKVILGTNVTNAQAIDDIEQIRQRAISATNKLVSGKKLSARNTYIDKIITGQRAI
uniref:Aminotransferase-like protein n=1 Tax=Oryza sativa subsp. indica TaxID=39946 RepID=C8TFB2_ORYSI|nr:aminotransferase-like protein [Oryza sativa Indica Group]BAI39965.1 aminotransferase-like protein [Oryza sativa Indica Group]